MAISTSFSLSFFEEREKMRKRESASYLSALVEFQLL